MKVLLTGGAGYIGTGLINQLFQDHEVDQIIVYDNLSRSNRNLFIGRNKIESDRLKFIHGDILDSRKLRSALKGVNVVYHLAANVKTPFSDQNPHLFEQVNHWGTAELVYALEESEVERVIHLSSVSVYGTSNQPLGTDSPLNPRTFYGISKMRAEEHVNRLRSKMKAFIIRCGNVYGYNRSMRFDAVINRFMFEANFHKQITINGSGKQRRPFVQIDRLCQSLSKLANSEVEDGVYNAVDQNYAIGEVVENIRQLYPELEMLFVNQHMKMRDLSVLPSKELIGIGHSDPNGLYKDLESFKRNFTF